MADLPISGLPAITIPSNSYLLAAVSASVTSQMTVKQVGDAYSSSYSPFPYSGSARITGSLGLTGSLYTTGSNNSISGLKTAISGGLYIQSSSLFSQNTASSIVSYDTASGQLYHTTYLSVLPALFSVGAFYSTGSVTATANQSGSFAFTTTLGIDSLVLANSGSHVVINKAATYNFQFSIQISNGASAADVAVWLKKNDVNVADTATYITVPSNQKAFIALNLWDTANAGDFYEIAYQSNQPNTTFQTIAATGNIPRSPSIILTVNQVR